MRETLHLWGQTPGASGLAVISDKRLSSNSGAELLKILVGPRLISARDSLLSRLAQGPAWRSEIRRNPLKNNGSKLSGSPECAFPDSANRLALQTVA